MDYFLFLLSEASAQKCKELIYRNVKNNFQHMLKTLFFTTTWAGFLVQFDTFP